MSRILPVSSDNKVIYEITIQHDFEQLLPQLQKLGLLREQKICIVTDSNVESLYAGKVKELLEHFFEFVCIYTFPAGEENKNLDTVNRLYEYLILNHFYRKDVLLALGGGVVGDMTGFAAATFLRGIDFVQIPTTLLSQVDSSIGGKTGVDFMQYKNMVGAFYMPKLVYMNLSVLCTLPKEQIISGMGEVLKHGLIKDKSYFKWIRSHQNEITRLDQETMEELVYRSCEIKRAVVERDPKEMGERALLNFGHTIGHAVEKLSDFKLYHGECVAIGMAAASYLSFLMHYISKEELKLICETLRSFGFRLTTAKFDPKDVLLATKSDKKMNGSKVRFILLSSVGEACICQDLTDDQIYEAIVSYVLES